VPLALIATILIQTTVAGMWLGKVEERLAQHSLQLSALSVRDAAHDGEARRIAEYLARLDERLAAQNATLLRLDARLAAPPGRSP
jgi:hypothetical protein